jgi:glycosyltransferase involved in cell wall biosynthesis
MSVNKFNGKALFIVSNTAQVDMFKSIVKYLPDFQFKFVNTEIFSILPEMEDYFRKYNLTYINMNDWSMKSVQQIIGDENPDILVTGHDQSPMDILFIKTCNELDIPSLTVQDGLLAAVRFDKKSVNNKLEYFYKMSLRLFKLFFNPYRPFKYKISRLRFEFKYGRGYSYTYGRGESSKIALFGDNTKNLLVGEGVSPDRLMVTGSSKFDDLLQYKDSSVKESLKEKYDVPSDKKVVLVLTSWFVEAGLWTVEMRRFFISEIAKACVNFKDVQLVFKLHAPHENKRDYINLLKDYPLSPLIYDTESLHELISISDVVVSVSSTAALEALALDKPCLIVNLDNGSKIFKDGGVLFIEKTDSIPSALEKLVYHPWNTVDLEKMRKFVYDEAYKIDGKSSMRISELIREMVSKKKIVMI